MPQPKNSLQLAIFKLNYGLELLWSLQNHNSLHAIVIKELVEKLRLDFSQDLAKALEAPSDYFEKVIKLSPQSSQVILSLGSKDFELVFEKFSVYLSNDNNPPELLFKVDPLDKRILLDIVLIGKCLEI